MKKITTVILAAGKSSRFKSKVSKLIYPLCGLPLILHIFNIAKKISGENIIVICNKDNIKNLRLILPGCKLIIQKKQLGTANAVEYAKNFIKTTHFITLSGDSPLVTIKSLKKLINHYSKSSVKISVIAFKATNPKGYGRMIVKKNYLHEVVEQIHLNKKQEKINICNSGIMICEKNIFFKNLNRIKTNKVKKEKYLPDIFKVYSNLNIPVNFVYCDENEMLGVNTIEDLLIVEKVLQNKYIDSFIKIGVIFNNPHSCYFNFDTKIEKDVIIENNITFKNNIKIRSGSIIKSNSYLEGANIGSNCEIGPNARIRSKSKIGNNSKIGNFVEIKNSKIGNNVSIAHLSYVGDSKIGNNVNIGAGTITCNYDGKKKHKTIIKDNVFIGSNTSLIAPVVIESKSRIGAGSVITKNIPKNSLAIERSTLKILRNKRSK